MPKYTWGVFARVDALGDVPLGSTVTLLASDSTPPNALRLAELGLRHGARLDVLARTAGNGRVVAVGQSRIALGRELTRRLRVRVLAEP